MTWLLNPQGEIITWLGESAKCWNLLWALLVFPLICSLLARKNKTKIKKHPTFGRLNFKTIILDNFIPLFSASLLWVGRAGGKQLSTVVSSKLFMKNCTKQCLGVCVLMVNRKKTLNMAKVHASQHEVKSKKLYKKSKRRNYRQL